MNPTPQPKPEPVKSARWTCSAIPFSTRSDICQEDKEIAQVGSLTAKQITAAHNAAVEALEREVERLKSAITAMLKNAKEEISRREYYEVDSDDMDGQCCLAEGYIHQQYAEELEKALAAEIRAEIGGEST